MKTKFSLIFTVISILIFTNNMLSYAQDKHINQRPLITEQAYVLDSRAVDLKLGTTFKDNTSAPFTDDKNDRNILTLPEISLAIGINENVEFQTEFEFINLSEEGYNTKYTIGDLKLWTKIKLKDETELFPALGLKFGTKLPNASNENRVGTDETDFYFILLGSKKIGSIYLNANAGLGILGDPANNNTQDDILAYGISIVAPVFDTLNFVSELQGIGASNKNNSQSVARFGIQLTKGIFTWDVSTSAGITKESPDWSIGTGITAQIKY